MLDADAPLVTPMSVSYCELGLIVMNTLLIPQHSTFPNNYFLITQFNVRFIVYPERQIKGVMSWYSRHLHVNMEFLLFKERQGSRPEQS